MLCLIHLALGVIIQQSFFRSSFMELYIKSSACISAQNSFESNGLPHDIVELDTPFGECVRPEYKKYISPKLLRRMSPIIRNGVCCSKLALQEAGIEIPDAIIVGTALGCLKDTDTFLTQLIEGNEELPNPTAFIQSTHNTIAGQVALLLGCKNYNFTFSQMHSSFETALLDAQMLLWDNEGKDVLVGGVDEIPESLAGLLNQSYCYSKNKLGEGAGFFVLSSEKSPIVFNGLKIIYSPHCDFEKELNGFSLSLADIDLLIGGDNCDNDQAYTELHNMFCDKPYVWYKPFMGEFGTASALALWLAVKALEQKEVPAVWRKNDIEIQELRNVLVYNRFGNEHSLMVLSLKE